MGQLRKPVRFWTAVFLAPAVAMFVLVYLYPLITVTITSFTRWTGLSVPQFIGLNNFLRLLHSNEFRFALVNTLIWGLVAAFIHVPFGVTVALILARKPKGWRFTRAVFMIPNVIGWTALSLLFRFVYEPNAGILDGLLKALGITKHSINWLYDPHTAFVSVTFIWLPFAAVITLITMAELLSIPPEVQEAAQIDGASPLQIDLRVNLPMVWPIVGTGMILAVTAVFKQFEIIYLTTGGGPGNNTMIISVMIVNNIFDSQEYGYANALAFVLLIIGMIVVGSIQLLFRLSRSYYE